MTQEELEKQVRTQVASFNEIMMNEDTRALSSIDLAGIKGAVDVWRRDGVRLATTALLWGVLPYSHEERQELLNLALSAGWLPLYVDQNQTEYRIVKSANGRKLFGGEKVRFRLYELMASGRFRFLSEHGSINMAAWALNKEFMA